MPALRQMLRLYSNVSDAPLYLAGAAAITTVVSIRAFEILMVLALLALIVTRRRWRLPPVWIPLALFLLGTLVSLAASGHVRDGLPQVRKFYVYLMLFLVTSAFETVRQIRWVALGWALAAALSSLWALGQFLQRYRAAERAHQDFYSFYVDARITGFMGHWMTLGGELMIALLLIGALVFFATDRTWTGWLIAAALPVAAALAATWTRSMWLGAFCGGVYLIWYWKPWTLLALPVLIALDAAGESVQPARARALGCFAPPGPNRFQRASRRTAPHRLGDDQGASLAGRRARTGLASVSRITSGRTCPARAPPNITATWKTTICNTRPNAVCPPRWPCYG
jgi:hypothetical protein